MRRSGVTPGATFKQGAHADFREDLERQDCRERENFKTHFVVVRSEKVVFLQYGDHYGCTPSCPGRPVPEDIVCNGNGDDPAERGYNNAGGLSAGGVASPRFLAPLAAAVGSAGPGGLRAAVRSSRRAWPRRRSAIQRRAAGSELDKILREHAEAMLTEAAAVPVPRDAEDDGDYLDELAGDSGPKYNQDGQDYLLTSSREGLGERDRRRARSRDHDGQDHHRANFREELGQQSHRRADLREDLDGHYHHRANSREELGEQGHRRAHLRDHDGHDHHRANFREELGEQGHRRADLNDPGIEDATVCHHENPIVNNLLNNLGALGIGFNMSENRGFVMKASTRTSAD